ncbi:MAG: hypothetical protein ACRDDY_00150 [Clostridium sp.]|uniref:hypothetical protein n=1 Tax=Clostridium sp. TaxID=1506 RepID=UPI003EE70D67
MRYKPMKESEYRMYAIINIIIGIIAIIGCGIVSNIMEGMQALGIEAIIIVVFLIIFAGLNHKMNKFRG